MSLNIAIISANPGWHGARLKEAFARHGAQSRYVALEDCAMQLDGDGPGLLLPGFEERLPDGVFVREVPGGTLEEVVFWLDILHALDALGIPVYNTGRMIERSVDKALTSFLLQQGRVATPASWIYNHSEVMRGRIERLLADGETLVFKPLFGSQGKGILKITHAGELPDADTARGIYYLQRFVDTGTEARFDWRVFVIGGKAVAAMQRHSQGWITNVANGAECQPAVLTEELSQLAEASLRQLDMQYGGVDIMRDRDGRYWVLEVNSIPAWYGLQSVCSVDIADALARDFLPRCQPHAQVRAV